MTLFSFLYIGKQHVAGPLFSKSMPTICESCSTAVKTLCALLLTCSASELSLWLLELGGPLSLLLDRIFSEKLSAVPSEPLAPVAVSFKVLERHIAMEFIDTYIRTWNLGHNPSMNGMQCTFLKIYAKLNMKIPLYMDYNFFDRGSCTIWLGGDRVSRLGSELRSVIVPFSQRITTFNTMNDPN